jgi:hypothetical protein
MVRLNAHKSLKHKTELFFIIDNRNNSEIEGSEEGN